MGLHWYRLGYDDYNLARWFVKPNFKYKRKQLRYGCLSPLGSKTGVE
jgi:hypothetical protein